MRRVFLMTMLGGALWISGAAGQDSADGREADRHHKNRPTTAADALFENGPDRPHALAEVQAHEAEIRAEAAKTPSKESQSNPATPPPPPPAPVIPVQAQPPGPPQKNLTGQEFQSVHMGATLREVLNLLGPASSRIVVPDEDGHLLETLQYWVNGIPAATIRLDNGRVVEIRSKQK